MKRHAVLQCADTGPLESLVAMLIGAGYTCYLPSKELKAELRRIGCDTVLDVDDLVNGMGYDRPYIKAETGPFGMVDADLYVDVKAHRNYEHVVKRWPNLAGKVLWYRINGGMPEHVVNQYGDMGDEINPPCPVLTPNQWYAECKRCGGAGCYKCDLDGAGTYLGSTKTWAYTCWPPFVRFDDYFSKRGRPWTGYDAPICLIHNVQGWGYGALLPSIQERGVKIYGRGSPDGLINHRQVPDLLARSLAMVHLKSSDAPGYALYEALAAACPIVCTRRLIWRCKMQDLLIPNETCLVFDRETHDGLTAEDVYNCTMEVGQHLQRLRDPIENKRIGLNGYNRLKEIMWSQERDGPGFAEWMRRAFP